MCGLRCLALRVFFALRSSAANEEIMTPKQVNGSSNEVVGTASANVIVTSQSRVACNGGGGPLGHPNIFLTLGTDGSVTCPYCSRVFVRVVD